MSKRPLFLLSNDDGVHAPGLRTLAEAVEPFGDVLIVAPHVERSGASSMLSIHQPLRLDKIEDNIYAVEGSPVDCILLALRRLVDRVPDWVISGINRGGNLAQDTLYSGTVGAALEGSIHGIRAMAISSHGAPPYRYDTASKVVAWFLRQSDKFSQFGGVLNINVPNRRFEDLRGIRVTELGHRVYDQQMEELTDPRGRPYYWVGGGGNEWHDIPDSDCVTIAQGYVTVTALTPTLIDKSGNQFLRENLAVSLQEI